jgi:hypothetical protein
VPKSLAPRALNTCGRKTNWLRWWKYILGTCVNWATIHTCPKCRAGTAEKQNTLVGESNLPVHEDEHHQIQSPCTWSKDKQNERKSITRQYLSPTSVAHNLFHFQIVTSFWTNSCKWILDWCSEN